MIFDVQDKSLAFIGSGRLCTGLALAFHANGIKISAIAGRNAGTARALAARFTGCEALSAEQAVEQCELVFIGVPDDSIATVANSLRWRAGQSVVHCSGATEVDVLDAAKEAGALTGGFHPLQTFTDPQVALRTLPGCTVAIEAPEPLLTKLSAMARAIGSNPFALPAGARARYHATGSYAAQFINALLLQAGEVWASFGMDRQAAVQALLPLLKGTVAAIEHDGLARGLAGPVSRGDAGTVRRQFDGIAGVSERHLALFRELTRLTLPLAIERGNLDAAKIAALRALLDADPNGPAQKD